MVDFWAKKLTILGILENPVNFYVTVFCFKLFHD